MSSPEKIAEGLIAQYGITAEKFRGQDGMYAAPNATSINWSHLVTTYLAMKRIPDQRQVPEVEDTLVADVVNAVFGLVMATASEQLYSTVLDTCQKYNLTNRHIETKYVNGMMHVTPKGNGILAVQYLANDGLTDDQKYVLLASCQGHIPPGVEDVLSACIACRLEGVLEAKTNAEDAELDRVLNHHDYGMGFDL